MPLTSSMSTSLCWILWHRWKAHQRNLNHGPCPREAYGSYRELIMKLYKAKEKWYKRICMSVTDCVVQATGAVRLQRSEVSVC